MNGDAARHMARALRLAEHARGLCSPNPAVGAVLVRDGEVVGEGWTQPPGEAHAEVMALRQAGSAANGATLYVTLEPCAHFGRTPPCAQALIEAGVAEVRAAIVDPNPLVSGRGFRALAEADVRVVTGLGARRAVEQNEAFLKHTTTGQPFVTAKWAMTLDGKIATRTGDSRWISGPASRRLVHRWRAVSDAVLIGVGTALADDPELTARDVDGPVRQPLRVVLDTRARLPLTAKLLSPALAEGTVIAVGENAPVERVEALRATGAQVWRLPVAGSHVDLAEVFCRLGAREVMAVLIEGGAEVVAAALAAGLIDKAGIFVGPKLFGGRQAPGPVAGDGVARVAEAPAFDIERVETIGRDALLVAYPAVAGWRERLLDAAGVGEGGDDVETAWLTGVAQHV